MAITTTARNACEYVRDIGSALARHWKRTPPLDEQVPFSEIVKILGLDAGLWCCRAEPQHDKEWRLFAVWCARQVQHLMTDPRSVAALDVAERFAHGKATQDELSAACDAATEAQNYAPWGTPANAAKAAQHALFENAAKAALSAQEAMLSAVRSAKRDEARTEFLKVVG